MPVHTCTAPLTNKTLKRSGHINQKSLHVHSLSKNAYVSFRLSEQCIHPLITWP